MPNGSDGEYSAYVQGRLSALRRAAYLLSGDAHQADDIVQETLTKLYVRWPRIHQVDNIDAYVNTMLIRVFLDDRRRGWWRVALPGWLPEPAPSVTGPSEDPHVVRAALAQLPPRQQAVLVLRFLCDQPVKDVAQLLHCSEGTVKSQTAHGLTRLRKLLGTTMSTGAVAQDRR